MESPEQARRLQESQELYDRYGKPLEAEHWGEFAAIDTDGTVILAPTLREALFKSEALSPKGFVFKIGEIEVGMIRQLRRISPSAKRKKRWSLSNVTFSGMRTRRSTSDIAVRSSRSTGESMHWSLQEVP